MGSHTMLAADLLDFFMEIREISGKGERGLTQSTDNLARIFNQLFVEATKEKQIELVTLIFLETIFISTKYKVSLGSMMQTFINRRYKYFQDLKSNPDSSIALKNFFEEIL